MAHSSSHSDIATQVVGDNDRIPRRALTMVWFSVCSALFYLLLGATLALKFGTRNALIGTVLGVIALSVLAFPFSRHAIRSGQSCYLLSREILEQPVPRWPHSFSPQSLFTMPFSKALW